MPGMTTTKSRGGRGQRTQKSSIHDGEETDAEKRKKKRDRPASNFRKAYRGGTKEEKTNHGEDTKKQDDKLRQELSESLQDYSRQRLRAVHMSLRQYSADGSIVSTRDLQQALQENNVRIPARLQQTLMERYEDSKGIRLEAFNKFLTDAHSKTGRDSVLAMHKRNDLTPRQDVALEDLDEDLIWRVESLLVQSQTYIDIERMRTAFQNKDSGDSGRIESSVVKQVCSEQDMPVFGALLKNLMKRCDEERNEKISWPEFLSFLERAQQNAWVTSPELKELPEKLKSQVPVAPSPLDELSSRTRNTLVNKLRKKSTIRRPEPFELAFAVGKETLDGTSDSADTQTVTVSVIDKSGNGEQGIETSLPSGTGDVTSAFPVEVIIDVIPPDAKMDESNDEGKNGKVTSDKNDNTVTSEPYPTCDVEDKEEEPATNDVKAQERQLPPADAETTTLPNLSTTVATTTTAITTTVTIEEQTSITDQVSVSMQQQPQADREDGSAKATLADKESTSSMPETLLMNQTIDPPNERLRLLWVYGYRGNDCRKNIHVLGEGEIVYFMSYIAVIHNNENHSQRHYKEHTDDIKCIDVHSDGQTVATGQFANRKKPEIQAHVRVWRADTLQTMHVLGQGQFERSVVCLAFSPGKDLLAAVDNSMEKRLITWNTSTGTATGETTLETDLVCDVGFNRKDPDVLVTIGKEHVCWWKLYEESRTIQNTAKPDYENFLRAKFVICMTFTENGDCITGDSNGTIYVWGEGGSKITNFVKHAHDGPVFSVLWNHGHVISGGRDGIIHCWQWTKTMDAIGFLQVPKLDGGVRMLQRFGDDLLVGTTMNSIRLVKLSQDDSGLGGAELVDIPITQGHYDELRGLTVLCPPLSSSSDIITAGMDGIISTYSSSECRAVGKTQLKRNQFTSVDVVSSGLQLCLGTKDGHLQVLQRKEDQMDVVMDQKICKEELEVIRFSPDAGIIAAGSIDSNIYVFNLRDKDDKSQTWDFIGKLKGHSGAVRCLDWSKDRMEGDFILRSCSSEEEQKFWKPGVLEEIPAAQVTSTVAWATNSCTVDALLSGVKSGKHMRGEDIQCLDVHPSGTLVAVGDSTGNLHLFRYPVITSGALNHTYRSHACVHNVRFTACGRYIVTVGGRDSTLMQWEIV